MNKKSFAFLFMTLIFSINAFNQNCNCESNFNWVKTTYEQNDAGFQYILDKKGLDNYNAYSKDFLNRSKNISNINECTLLIGTWLKYFRNGHTSISIINNSNSVNSKTENREIKTEKVEIESSEFEKYLQNENLSDLEGIWESKPYLIGIKKFNDEYKGFIIKSEIENWKANDIKFKINLERKKGTYFLRDKTAQSINKIKLIGKNHLTLGSFSLIRIAPKYENHKKVDLYIKSLFSKTPYIEQLNKSTLILRIPSFDGIAKKSIDSVISQNKSKIEKTENLIIDLRNNGGGSDGSFQNLLPYIYTNPLRTITVEFLSTKLNNQRMLKFYENYKDYGFDEEDRNKFKKDYELLEQNLGNFVNLNKEKQTVRVTKFDKVLPFPKNIGIIINEENASTTEQFLLYAKQSKKVKLFGKTTFGALDVSNMNFVESPCNEIKLGYCLSKSLRIPDMAIDDKGIQPDYFLDNSIPDEEWIEYVNNILTEK